MHPRVIITAAAVCCLAAAPSRADTTNVFVFNLDFSAAMPGQPIVDPVIELGDTIRWIWLSGHHTTTSVKGIPEQWDSDVHSPPFFFEHTFTHEGVFWYYCIPHGGDNGDGTASGMAGTITVIPAPAALPLLAAGGFLAGRRRGRRTA